MKKQNFSSLYRTLLIKKYNDIEEFLHCIKNKDDYFWECCRDVTKETLLNCRKWNWLGNRVDDFAKIVEKDVVSKLEKWKRKGSFAIVCNSNKLDNVIDWLFERHISMHKNLFDPRYKNSLDISFHIHINDIEISISDNICENEIKLDEFSTFDDFTKIKILKELWNDNLLDFDFNFEDLKYLCQKYQAPPPETFIKIEIATKYEVKQNENGNSQLVFNF